MMGAVNSMMDRRGPARPTQGPRGNARSRPRSLRVERLLVLACWDARARRRRFGRRRRAARARRSRGRRAHRIRHRGTVAFLEDAKRGSDDPRVGCPRGRRFRSTRTLGARSGGAPTRARPPLLRRSPGRERQAGARHSGPRARPEHAQPLLWRGEAAHRLVRAAGPFAPRVRLCAGEPARARSRQLPAG